MPSSVEKAVLELYEEVKNTSISNIRQYLTRNCPDEYKTQNSRPRENWKNAVSKLTGELEKIKQWNKSMSS